MSLQIQGQANILHGTRGRWTVRSKIINVLLIREDVNHRMTIEKWIDYRGGELFDPKR